MKSDYTLGMNNTVVIQVVLKKLWLLLVAGPNQTKIIEVEAYLPWNT